MIVAYKYGEDEKCCGVDAYHDFLIRIYNYNNVRDWEVLSFDFKKTLMTRGLEQKMSWIKEQGFCE